MKLEKPYLLIIILFIAALFIAQGCSEGKTTSPKKNIAAVRTEKSVPPETSATAPVETPAPPAEIPPVKPGESVYFEGLIYYPNATEDKEGAVDTPGDNGVRLRRRELVTSDPAAVVAEFYKKRYPAAKVFQYDNKNFTFKITGGGAEKLIVVFPDPVTPGKTAIKLIADSK